MSGKIDPFGDFEYFLLYQTRSRTKTHVVDSYATIEECMKEKENVKRDHPEYKFFITRVVDGIVQTAYGMVHRGEAIRQ